MNDLNESQLIPVLLFLSKGQKNNVHTQVAWTKTGFDILEI